MASFAYYGIYRTHTLWKHSSLRWNAPDKTYVCSVHSGTYALIKSDTYYVCLCILVSLYSQYLYKTFFHEGYFSSLICNYLIMFVYCTLCITLCILQFVYHYLVYRKQTWQRYLISTHLSTWVRTCACARARAHTHTHTHTHNTTHTLCPHTLCLSVSLSINLSVLSVQQRVFVSLSSPVLKKKNSIIRLKQHWKKNIYSSVHLFFFQNIWSIQMTYFL